MREIPFGVSELDWEKGRELGKVPWENQGEKIWLNLGRLAPSMGKALEAFFRAMAIRPPPPGTKIIFAGTSYERGKVSEVDPLGMAARLCPGVRVEAMEGRLPLLYGVKALQSADRLLFFGSDDPGYTPSRLFQYLQAKKPLLAILHQKSPAHRLGKNIGMPGLIGFLEEKPADIAEKISRIEWGALTAAGSHMYTARQMTEELKNLFKTALKNKIEA